MIPQFLVLCLRDDHSISRLLSCISRMSRATLDRLPDELILKICRHLLPQPGLFNEDRAGNASLILVSKRFHKLGLPLLYSSVSLCNGIGEDHCHGGNFAKFAQTIETHPDYAAMTSFLQMSLPDKHNVRFVEDLLLKIANVSVLELRYTIITPATIDMLKQMPSLHTLILHQCPFEEAHLTNISQTLLRGLEGSIKRLALYWDGVNVSNAHSLLLQNIC